MELGQSLWLYLKRVSSTGGNSLALKYLCNTENRVIASNDSGTTVSFPLTSLSMKAWIGSTVTKFPRLRPSWKLYVESQ